MKGLINNIWEWYKRQAWLLRIAAAGALGSAIFGTASGIFLSAVPASAESTPAPQINGNCNFPGGTNNGSIVCNNTFNAVPEPHWYLETQLPIKQNPDGSFLRVANLQIKLGYSAENLIATVTGSNIISFNIISKNGPMFNKRTWSEGNIYYVAFDQPHGKYFVYVTTKDAGSPPIFNAQFNYQD